MILSSQEKKSLKLTSRSLKQSAQKLAEQGFVVLEEALPKSWIESMKNAVEAELYKKYEGSEHELSLGNNHGGVEFPLCLPFIDPLIIENSMIFQILERALGNRFYGHLPYGSNTAFPGSSAQNVHRDSGHIFPEVPTAMPPALIVVNIALDDFTLENGATEVWPESHFLVDASESESVTLRIPPERYVKHPSKQIVMPAGSIFLRDMRTWHRGMQNTTDQSRTMLTIVYYRPYFFPDSYSLNLPAMELDRFSEQAKRIYRLRLSKA